MPPDAVGVVVEGMMLAEVITVDTERGCITVRALDGDTASYRIVSPAETRVAVGEPVIIEVERALFASAGDAPSASPRMTEPKAGARVGTSPGVSSNKHDARESVETKTTISTAARATVISHAVRCSTP